PRQREQDAAPRHSEPWPDWSYPSAPRQWDAAHGRQADRYDDAPPPRRDRYAAGPPPPRPAHHRPDHSIGKYSERQRTDASWDYRMQRMAAWWGEEEEDAAAVSLMPEVGRRLTPGSAKQRGRRGGWLARRWRSGRGARAVIIALVMTILFGVCAPGAFLARAAFAASDGYNHLTKIELLVNQDGVAALLNPANQDTIQGHLAAAHTDFVTLAQTLGMGDAVVSRNGGLRNLVRLTHLAVDMTGAGQDLLTVATSTLAPLLNDPFAASTPTGLQATALLAAHARLADADAAMRDAAAIAPTITDEGLPAALGPHGKLGKLLGRVGDIAQLAHAFSILLDDAPALLGVGTPATYLLLAMDRSELRTGGGFIGNYGILTLQDAHLQQTHLQDTYVLDAAYFARTGQQPPATYPWWPYHGASAVYGWGLRDSNLSPDFPTNARAAMGILNAVGTDAALRPTYPLQGTVAITSVVMAQIIATSGGTLRLPEYPKHTLTPTNLDDTIHCFQLGACRDETPTLQRGDTASSDRKRFTAFLGQALVDRVRHMHGDQLKAFMKLIFTDIAAKDIQLYFANPRAEGVLLGANYGAGLAEGTDTFFVTDTNIGGNKANAYVTQDAEDIVTLLADGSALHHLRLHTVYARQGPLYEGSTGQTSYWDYRRIYFPTTARWLGSAGVTGGSGRHQLGLTTRSDVAARHMFGAALTIDDGTQVNNCRPFPKAPITQPWNCAPQMRDTYYYWQTPHAWQLVNGQAHY
ncbi:MAG: DUF4012 domain-containing protein, partial [Ktedonobacterales bacterium]|nr:DUF4012 domain-containing protein [Ktedonobacterales bacterium]